LTGQHLSFRFPKALHRFADEEPDTRGVSRNGFSFVAAVLYVKPTDPMGFQRDLS
jgi:hypothetical protein